MLHVGITGGIGSGKSTVARMLGELGAQVLDADGIVRELLGPGQEGTSGVRRDFGEAFVGPDGGTDRKALAALVFDDPEARLRLESILHPLVIARRRALLAEILRERGAEAVVVSEAALIFEAGTRREFDGVLFVTAPDTVRRARLVAGGWDPGEVDRRMASQWPDSEKAPLADWVVDNGGEEEKTRRQVRALWPAFVEMARARR